MHFRILVSHVQRTSVCEAAENVVVRLYIQRGTLRPGDRHYAQTSFQSTGNCTVLSLKKIFFWYINFLFALL